MVSRKTGYSTLYDKDNVCALTVIASHLRRIGVSLYTYFTNNVCVADGFTIYRHTPQHIAASNLNFDILFKLIEYDASMSIKIERVDVFKAAEMAGASTEQLEELHERMTRTGY